MDRRIERRAVLRAGSLTNGYAAGSWQKVIAHGAAGGIADVAGGDNFWNGALSAGLSEGGSPWIDSTWTSTTGRSIAHAGLGAATSALTGGDSDAIRQGAINGGFGYWFNEQLHYVQTPDGQMTVESPGERYDMSGAFEMMPGVMALKCAVDGCTPLEKVLAGIDFVPLKVPGAGGLGKAIAGEVGDITIAYSRAQLQHAFKHAGDFGVLGNANTKALGEFSSAIQSHIASPATTAIEGTYRGQAVTHFVDPNTGLNVIRDASGNFVSGWRLSQKQLEHVLKDGKLGGG